MNTSDYQFALPEELIAQHPATERTQSRLLVLRRDCDLIEHVHFYDLPRYLQPGDLLVANDSRVIPARLFGVKEETGAAIELLLLRPMAQPGCWEVLSKPGKRLKSGHRISFGDGLLVAEVEGTLQGGTRIVQFSVTGEVFDALLESLGEMPLPPYIHEKLADPERYQTVYAKELGSVAAPTAGLHFTPQLLDELAQKGVGLRFVTLHVGLGTFRPVQSDHLEDHHMHEEWFAVKRSLLEEIRRTKEAGHRVLTIGTTTVRALESACMAVSQSLSNEHGDDLISGLTDIFIYPGYRLKATDALITNFHLPKSTLLMLVSALVGREKLLAAYDEAVHEQYRFFSFGDAMLIL